MDGVKNFIKSLWNKETFETEAKQIFYEENNELKPNWYAIKSILLDDDVKDELLKFIVIAGLEGTGKSTLCNLLLYFSGLRYDESNFAESSDTYDAVENKSNQVKVKNIFKASLSAAKTTSGIWMTSKPISQKINGKEIRLFIVDCQGVCGAGEDSREKTVGRLTMILGTILASNFVYNISRKIQEHDETLLIDFVSDAKRVSTITEIEPIVLIRNWLYTNDCKFGSVETHDYYKAIKGRKPGEFSTLFNKTKCFLMPQPFEINEKGDYQLINKDKFFEMARKLHSILIDDKDDRVKYLEGTEAKGETMYKMLYEVWQLIQKQDIKLVYLTILDAKYEVINRSEYENSFDMYIQNMKGRAINFIEQISLEKYAEMLETIKNEHKLFEQQAIERFNQKSCNNGMGLNGNDYRTVLIGKISSHFQGFIENANKYKESWTSYINGINDFILKELRSLKEITADSSFEKFEIALKSEHQKLKNQQMKEFKGTVCDININQRLKKKMESMYSFIRHNINLIVSKTKKYMKEMDEGYDNGDSISIYSNLWISLDNTNWKPYMVSPSHEVNESELKLNFNDFFYQITEVLYQKKYKSLKLREDISAGGTICVGSMSAVGGSIGVVLGTTGVLATGGIILGLAAVGAGGYFLVTRYLKREVRTKEQERTNKKKNN